MAKANKDPYDVPVEMDRRTGKEQREDGGRRTANASVDEERRTAHRRKVQRRRQIDPTTCERDYSNDEIEFMHAMDEYKRSSGRMFPTCSEILEVVRALGYERTTIIAVTTSPDDGTFYENPMTASLETTNVEQENPAS